MRNAIALAYQYNTSRLFYSDIQRGTINAVYFNGTGHTTLLDRESYLMTSYFRLSEKQNKIIKQTIFFISSALCPLIRFFANIDSVRSLCF